MDVESITKRYRFGIKGYVVLQNPTPSFMMDLIYQLKTDLEKEGLKVEYTYIRKDRFLFKVVGNGASVYVGESMDDVEGLNVGPKDMLLRIEVEAETFKQAIKLFKTVFMVLDPEEYLDVS